LVFRRVFFRSGVYGIGIGLSSIAHGTVPLALFGQKHYARLMGRIALPSLLAQAAAPLIGTVLIQNFGHQTTLIVLGIFATLSFMLTVWLLVLHLGRRRASTSVGEPVESSISAVS